jgi:hypothetical protein
VGQADLCEIHYDSFSQLLASIDVSGSENVTNRMTLFSLIMTVFASAAVFAMALRILFVIADIVNLVRKNNKENLCLIYVWLFTNAFYTLLALMGLFSSLPECMPNIDHILVSLFSSVLNAVVTCIFLAKVKMFSWQLNVRLNRNTQEVSQNPISLEVPPVFLFRKKIVRIQKWFRQYHPVLCNTFL